jgi:hypothetical protein
MTYESDTNTTRKIQVRVGLKWVWPIYNTFSKRVVSCRVNLLGSRVEMFDPYGLFFLIFPYIKKKNLKALPFDGLIIVFEEFV